MSFVAILRTQLTESSLQLGLMVRSLLDLLGKNPQALTVLKLRATERLEADASELLAPVQVNAAPVSKKGRGKKAAVPAPAPLPKPAATPETLVARLVDPNSGRVFLNEVAPLLNRKLNDWSVDYLQAQLDRIPSASLEVDRLIAEIQDDVITWNVVIAGPHIGSDVEVASDDKVSTEAVTKVLEKLGAQLDHSLDQTLGVPPSAKNTMWRDQIRVLYKFRASFPVPYGPALQLVLGQAALHKLAEAALAKAKADQ